MHTLQSSYFFDLAHYKHAAVFNKTTYVWEALPQIAEYLSSQILGNIETEIPSGAYLENPKKISIGKGSVVEPGAFIRGPCIIGEKCTIRQGAYIRGDLIAGNHCVIGHDTEIKNAILLNDVHAAHFAYVGDTILGNYVNLGAGTKCANLKLDNSHIVILFQGQHIPTGLRKLGAIIGDGTQIGCNAVINPGTLIGKNVACYPCVNFGGVIEANQVVKNNIKVLISPKTR